MRNRSCFLVAILSMSVVLIGCNNKASSSATSAAQPAPASAPAPSASSTSAPNATQSANDEAARQAAIQWALEQDKIKNDPDGQWAISATASTSYNNAQNQSPWSAWQATGAPNVQKYGDDGNAWAPAQQQAGI